MEFLCERNPRVLSPIRNVNPSFFYNPACHPKKGVVCEEGGQLLKLNVTGLKKTRQIQILLVFKAFEGIF
jgi:hypothetical protein